MIASSPRGALRLPSANFTTGDLHHHHQYSHCSKPSTSKPVQDSTVHSGIQSRLPSAVLPYLQLMRLDRPHGFLYFYLPHLYGAIHAANLYGVPAPALASACATLFLGTVFLRAASCTWNDLLDAPLDAQVERTRNRPIARGAVSESRAFAFVLALALAALRALFCLPWLARFAALPAVLGATVYPLTKRYTDFPQAFCAATFGFAALVGACAVDASSPAQLAAAYERLLRDGPSGAAASVMWLYAANVAWNFCYEVMYSYQDAADDVAAGVRSLAVVFPATGRGAKALVGAAAAAVVGSMALAGACAGFEPLGPFGVAGVGLTAATLAVKVWCVDLSDAASCRWWFARSGMITGPAMLLGIWGQYVLS